MIEIIKEEKEILTERNWIYKLDSSLRTAIENEDHLEIINTLKRYVDKIQNSNLEDFIKEEFQSYLEDHEIEFDEIKNNELEDQEAEDTINYLLDDFYDLCDNTSIWIEIG